MFVWFWTGSAALSAENGKPQQTPDVANMSYVLLTKNKNISIPLQQPHKLWALKEFDTQRPLVILFIGWTSNVKDPDNLALNLLWSAYRCRGNVNFVVSPVVWHSFLYSLIFWHCHTTSEQLNSFIFLIISTLAIRSLTQVSLHSLLLILSTWNNLTLIFWKNSCVHWYIIHMERIQFG